MSFRGLSKSKEPRIRFFKRKKRKTEEKKIQSNNSTTNLSILGTFLFQSRRIIPDDNHCSEFGLTWSTCNIIMRFHFYGPLCLTRQHHIIGPYGHRRTGRVSFRGLKSLTRIYFPIACTKIKWFCPNITRLPKMDRKFLGGCSPPSDWCIYGLSRKPWRLINDPIFYFYGVQFNNFKMEELSALEPQCMVDMDWASKETYHFIRAAH